MIDDFAGKSVVIWGLGREGKSTLRLLRMLPEKLQPSKIAILDKGKIDDPELMSLFGKDVEILRDFDRLRDFDIIMKAPGVSVYQHGLFERHKDVSKGNRALLKKITSQTDVFLRHFGEQTVGITGTKGKSTTTSLIYEVLKTRTTFDVRLVGNIGVPAFDELIRPVGENTIFVYELSAHQLEFVGNSPHIAVITNMLSDHLEHYGTRGRYHNAKFNISRFQNRADFCFDGANIEYEIKDKRPYKTNLIGFHNQIDIELAKRVCVDVLKVRYWDFYNTQSKFIGLPHRLEFIGKFGGRRYYNDSISTIPEATIFAVKSLLEDGIPVGSVIIGGMERGIDYTKLVRYIYKHPEIQWLMLPDTGRRIEQELRELITAKSIKSEKNDLTNIHRFDNLEDAILFAKLQVLNKDAVVLSPAAASYGFFKNFEDRGEQFRKLALNL